MKLKLGIVLFLFVLIISACNKEQLIEPNEEALCENMLYFDSYEEMNEELEKVMQMNQEARFEWEKSQGFLSAELEAERLYASINPEQFKSIDELKDFVERNKDLLRLRVDENGEYELDTKLSSNPFRYIANNNKLFQINDSVFKIFEDGIIIGASHNVEFLKRNNVDKEFCMNNAGFRYEPFFLSPELKSSGTDCGTEHTWRSTNDRDRLLVEIKVYNSGHKKVTCHFISRPYYRVMGIWYWCSQSMKVNIDLTFRYTDALEEGSSWTSYGPITENFTFSKGWITDNHFEKKTEIDGVWILYHDDHYPRFTKYNVWADTDKVSPINISCN